MKAGFAEREYTPEKGMVPGQIEVNYADGKITPLMAHVAVIESKGTGAVLVQLDILFVSSEFATKIRNRISEITGFPFEQVMVNCSHSHTGCATDFDCWDFRGKPEYLVNVEAAIFEALEAAMADVSEVSIGTGTGYDRRFNYCRDFYLEDGRIVTNPGSKHKDDLVRPYTAIDNSVNVMRFDGADGKPRCFIVNYANHLDTNPSKAKFDADYPGHMRLALKAAYGEDVAVIFFNGCCGNINHIDFVNYYHKTAHCAKGALPPKVIGEGLADTITKIDPPVVTSAKDINIYGLSKKHTTTRRRATAEQIAWAHDLAARKEAGEEVDLHTSLLVEMYLKDEKYPPALTAEFEITTLQIGPWAIVGLPGEIYSDIGLKIKANSPFANTIIVEIANGYNGYVSPDIIQRSGCYTGRYSMVAFTGLGTEKVLVDGCANMLNALNDAENIQSIGALKELK